MDFKFSFDIEGTQENNHLSEEHNSKPLDADDDVIDVPSDEQATPAQQIEMPDGVATTAFSYTIETTTDGLKVKYLHAVNCRSLQATTLHSDLVPGVYEGGATTWECSFILLEYLSTQDLDLSNTRVFEVGCGSGLPGLYCLLKGAKQVAFQDYNEDVIRNATIPNIQLSLADTGLNCLDLCLLFSGDWGSLSQLLTSKDKRYDLVLGSEIIYSVASYCKLHRLLETILSPDGSVLIASKYHYFGVGGGVEQFKDYCAKRNLFHVETVHTTDSNLHCIIQRLTWKQKS